MTATQRLVLASFKSAAAGESGAQSGDGSPGGSSGAVATGNSMSGGGSVAPSPQSSFAGVGSGGRTMGGGRIPFMPHFDMRGTMAGLARSKIRQPTFAGAPNVQNVGARLYG